MKSTTVEEGDTVILLSSSEFETEKERERKCEKIRICIIRDTIKLPGLGVLNLSNLIGKRYGSSIEMGRKKYYLMRPNIVDKIETIKRKAQIINPKDSAIITMYSGIGAGDTVIEAGIGSGALTIALCDRVRPDGKVISYEIKEEFVNLAKKNLEEVGLDHLHEVKLKDITKGIDEKDVDAIVLDLPEPWEAIPHAYHALIPGGSLAVYSPTVPQMELSVKKMWEAGFVEVKPFEILQRDWFIAEKSTRPSFDMQGHTAFIVVGRKILKE
ncbi:MAG: tRNA (adenine-N1)-methyltransferase [Thermoplasmata archaeon]